MEINEHSQGGAEPKTIVGPFIAPLLSRRSITDHIIKIINGYNQQKQFPIQGKINRIIEKLGLSFF